MTSLKRTVEQDCINAFFKLYFNQTGQFSYNITLIFLQFVPFVLSWRSLLVLSSPPPPPQGMKFCWQHWSQLLSHFWHGPAWNRSPATTWKARLIRKRLSENIPVAPFLLPENNAVKIFLTSVDCRPRHLPNRCPIREQAIIVFYYAGCYPVILSPTYERFPRQIPLNLLRVIFALSYCLFLFFCVLSYEFLHCTKYSCCFAMTLTHPFLQTTVPHFL